MAKKKSQPGEPKQGLPHLMELAMTKKAPMVGGIILSVLATVASFVPYLAINFVIREIVNVYPDFSALNINATLGYGALALGGVLANVLLYTASVALSHIAAYGTLYETKISFVSHITKLPLGYHLNTGSGKLRKIMDDNIESLEGFIAHDLPNMVSAFVSPVVMLVLLFAVDWRFGLATLAGIIVAFVLYGITSGGNTTQQLMTDYQASLENMSNASVEYIRGISVVKAFRQTAFSFKRLYDSIKNYTATVIPYSLSQELMTATLTAALNAIYLFLIPVGILVGSHTQDYQSFAATLIFYLIFVPAVAAILMKVIYAMVNTMQISGSVARLDQIMAEPEMKEGTHAEKPENYDIVFENVTFSYTEDGPSALKDISFTAKQGEVTAIVGPSGGGKSTIANLIPRFYDVEQGAIKIGGIDIRDMIDIQNVSYSYQEDGTDQSLRNIDLKIQDGECVLLCGKSGCGKTTITRLLNGMIPNFYEGAVTGKVLLDGKNLLDLPMFEISKKVGTVFQNPRTQFYTVNTTSEIAFGCENMGMPPEKITERVTQTAKDLQIEYLLNRNIFTLSGGEKQIVAFASIYAMSPRIYVLDEPSSNLDVQAIEKIRKILTLLKKQGKTIVIAEHRTYYLRDLIDRAVYLDNGEIVREYSMSELARFTVQEQLERGIRTVDLLHYPVKPYIAPATCESIQVDDLRFSYGKDETLHIDHMEIPSGHITDIIGTNGAGKSTFVSCLCGLLKKVKGDIYLFQKSHSPQKTVCGKAILLCRR